MTKEELLIKQIRRYADNSDMITRAHSREILSGYGNSELNCIDCIGRMKRPNASRISEELGITRSAITKILKKIAAKDAVEAYRVPNNQKEIYYRLTAYGREIFKQHRLRHRNWEARDLDFFKSLDSSMLETVLNFMNIYNGYLEMKLAELSEEETETNLIGDDEDE